MTVRMFKYSVTPEQAYKERQACFRQLNRKRGSTPLHKFIYPKGATLSITTANDYIEQDISCKAHNTVRKRILKIKRSHPIIEQVFITIPSKANHQ